MVDVEEVGVLENDLLRDVEVRHTVCARDALRPPPVARHDAVPRRSQHVLVERLVEEDDGEAARSRQPHQLLEHGEVVVGVGSVSLGVVAHVARRHLALLRRRVQGTVDGVVLLVADVGEERQPVEASLTHEARDEAHDPREDDVDRRGRRRFLFEQAAHARAAHEERLSGEQAGVVGGAVREPHGGEADGDQGLALGQVLDQRQRLGEALRVGGEADDAELLARRPADVVAQRLLAEKAFHRRRAAGQVHGRHRGRGPAQAGEDVRDVAVVVMAMADEVSLGHLDDDPGRDEQLEPQQRQHGERRRDHEHQRAQVAKAARERGAACGQAIRCTSHSSGPRTQSAMIFSA